MILGSHNFLSARFIGFSALWGGFLLSTIGFLRFNMLSPVLLGIGAICLLQSTREQELRRSVNAQKSLIVIIALLLASAGVSFLLGGGYLPLRSVALLGFGVGIVFLLVLYCDLYLREGQYLLVLLSFLGYYTLVLLWIFVIIRLFGIENLVRVGEGGVVHRQSASIGAEQLAAFGLFRISNLLNYFYFSAPVVALLSVWAFRNSWWLKVGVIAPIIMAAYIFITFAARGPVLIMGFVGVLFFILLLRRNFLAAVISLLALVFFGYLTMRLVDPLLLGNLLDRFKVIGEDGRIWLIAAGFKALLAHPFATGRVFEYTAHNLIIDYGLQYNIFVAASLVALLGFNILVSYRWVMAFMREHASRIVLLPLGLNLAAVLTVMTQPNLFEILGMWILSLGVLQAIWVRQHSRARMRARLPRRSRFPMPVGQPGMPVYGRRAFPGRRWEGSGL